MSSIENGECSADVYEAQKTYLVRPERLAIVKPDDVAINSLYTLMILLKSGLASEALMLPSLIHRVDEAESRPDAYYVAFSMETGATAGKVVRHLVVDGLMDKPEDMVSEAYFKHRGDGRDDELNAMIASLTLPLQGQDVARRVPILH